jgi:hypothetical protein
MELWPVQPPRAEPDFKAIAKRLYAHLVLTTAALETPGDLSERERQLVAEDATQALTDIEAEVKGY